MGCRPRDAAASRWPLHGRHPAASHRRDREGRGAAALDGKVLIAELSGSESVVHFAQGALTWVSQSHGVRAIEVGATARFYINVGECMYFDADGKRIAP